MKQINKILVAIDLSDYSTQTMEYAAELANELKATLIVINVINQRDVEAIKRVALEVPNITVGDYLENQEKERMELIQNLIGDTKCSHLSIKKLVCMGIPFQKLIHTVKDEGVDLVVMGAKGRSNLANVLFGSTAEKMFRHCPVPLLSIRNR